MNPRICSSLLALAAVTGGGANLLADTADAATDVTVYALTAAGSNQTAFADAKYWADYSTGTAVQAPRAPNSTKDVGLEYVITNNYSARTASGAATIYGHVTVGTLDSPGFIANKLYNASVNWSGGLTVVNGEYRAVSSGSGTPDFNRALIAGTVEVKSPKSAPFLFGGTSGYGVLISADISGADGTGIMIGNPNFGATNPSTFSGDNANYLGSFEFKTGSYLTNYVETATALGGAPSALVADAIKFTTKGVGALVFRSSVGDCQIPATRGLYFDGVEGGVIYPRTLSITVEEGASVEFLSPIHANGTCSNNRRELAFDKCGAGTLTLSGAFTRDSEITKFAFNVNEGRVVLGSESAIALTNAVSDKVWLRSPSAAPFTLAGYAVNEGAGFVVRHEKGNAGTFVLDAASSVAATPIKIRLVTDELGFDAYEVCVMKVPASVKTLSPADFVDVDVSSDYDYPNTTFRVDTDADGVQSVFLCRAANDTIAHLRFEDDFVSHVRKGTLSAAPTVVRAGAALTDAVANPRLSLEGDRDMTIGTNKAALAVNQGALRYDDPGLLFACDAQTIEFYVKADQQNRYQRLFGLLSGEAASTVSWMFLFDNGQGNEGVGGNDKLKTSFALVKSEGAEPSNTTNPIAAQSVADGAWHHVAYTFAPNAADDWKTDVAMFVDHVKVGSATAAGRVNRTASGAFTIAVDSRTANKLDAALDEIRITRGVLAPEQFLKLRKVRGGLMLIIR